ncbi:MAG: ExbD/TolR family protein [Myxococcota bacterium]
MKFGRARRADPLIDLTPMIDIVFQLVLFFMVSTTFVSAPGIQVELPRSNTDVVLTDNQDLSIWMTSAGEVYVDEQPVDIAALRQRLIAAAERDADTLVILKADTGVSHGRVVTVMDMARAQGLTRLAIATELPEGSSP